MSTAKQKRQQVLSWKLRMVMGAQGTLYPRERDLPPEIKADLQNLCWQLKRIEQHIVSALRSIK